MSFKENTGSQQQTAQETSNQQLDPQIKAALLQNYSDFNSNVPGYQPYSGSTVADLTPQQQQSFGLVSDIANNNTGGAAVNSGIAALQGIAGGGTAPQQVTTQGASAGLVDPTTISNVSTAPTTDVSRYLDPFIGTAVNATTAAAQNALSQQENQNASDATRLGAWRGNALSVQNGVAQGQSNLALDQTVANLEDEGYSQAQAQATADANRALSAQQSNQGTQLATGQTNANNTTQTNLANLAATLSAAQGNQQAGLAEQGLQTTAAQGLVGAGTQQLTNASNIAQLEDQAGTQQQQQQQAELQWAFQNNYLSPQQYAFALQQLRNQTLGLAGNPTLTQQQQTSQGTQSTQGVEFNSGISFNPISLVGG